MTRRTLNLVARGKAMPPPPLATRDPLTIPHIRAGTLAHTPGLRSVKLQEGLALYALPGLLVAEQVELLPLPLPRRGHPRQKIELTRRIHRRGHGGRRGGGPRLGWRG